MTSKPKPLLPDFSLSYKYRADSLMDHLCGTRWSGDLFRRGYSVDSFLCAYTEKGLIRKARKRAWKYLRDLENSQRKERVINL